MPAIPRLSSLRLTVASQFFTVEIFQTFVLSLFAIPNDIDDLGSIIESYPDECIILRINFFMLLEIERCNYRKFDIEERVVRIIIFEFDSRYTQGNLLDIKSCNNIFDVFYNTKRLK